jgi:hypothetical protein
VGSGGGGIFRGGVERAVGDRRLVEPGDNGCGPPGGVGSASSNERARGSLKVGDVGACILPLGRGASLTWRTQVDEAKHVLLGREARGGTALWGA